MVTEHVSLQINVLVTNNILVHHVDPILVMEYFTITLNWSVPEMERVLHQINVYVKKVTRELIVSHGVVTTYWSTTPIHVLEMELVLLLINACARMDSTVETVTRGTVIPI